MKKPLGIPKLNKPMYSIVFYHHITNDVMKYRFMSRKSADAFFDQLPSVSKPVMYCSERIR